MVLYLLRDLLRRNRAMYAWMAPIAIMMWVAPTNDGFDVRLTLTVSMFLAVALGPFTSATTIGLREIRQLPVRFRELWTLTWVASTVVSSGFVLAASLVAVATTTLVEHPSIGPDTLVLVTIYNFIYTNIVLCGLPVLNYVSRNMRPGATTTAATISVTAGFIGALGLPWFFAPLLPLQMEQVSLLFAAVLVIGVAASFGVLLWQPTAGIGMGVANRTQAAQRTNPRRTDSLTGLSRVLLPYLAVTSLVTCVIVIGYAWYASSKGGHVAAFLGDDDLSRAAYMLVAMSSPWMPWGRLLKHLPLSSRGITLLLAATPLATWCVIAGTVWALGPLFGSALPSWVSPTTLAWVAGMSAIVNALSFRNQGSVLWIVGPTVVTGPFLHGIIERSQNPWSLWFLLAAVIAFAAAAWINHRTLTRCGSASRAFRRPTAGIFSANGPVAQR